MTDEIRLDPIIAMLFAIAAVTFIGIGVGLLTLPGWGYVSIGIGYTVITARRGIYL